MDEIDIKKLEHRFIEVDSQLMAQNRIIDSQVMKFFIFDRLSKCLLHLNHQNSNRYA